MQRAARSAQRSRSPLPRAGVKRSSLIFFSCSCFSFPAFPFLIFTNFFEFLNASTLAAVLFVFRFAAECVHVDPLHYAHCKCNAQCTSLTARRKNLCSISSAPELVELRTVCSMLHYCAAPARPRPPLRVQHSHLFAQKNQAKIQTPPRVRLPQSTRPPIASPVSRGATAVASIAARVDPTSSARENCNAAHKRTVRLAGESQARGGARLSVRLRGGGG